MLTVKNAMKTLVWMQIFLCVFDKMKMEVSVRKRINVDKALVGK